MSAPDYARGYPEESPCADGGVHTWCKLRERGIIVGTRNDTGDGATAMLSIDNLFKGRHFDRKVITLCVRWYLRYKLSFRDLVEMMAERGLSLAHTTIMRRVHRYVPEFEKRWNRFARQVGGYWCVDETYVKIKGRWVPAQSFRRCSIERC